MRTSDFGAPLLDGELIASEDHCPACTQWGPESARRAVVWRKTMLVQHRRCTKPAGDATATTWPSRVLLLVERRGGASRASCAMELIPSDAADTRNRRWRAVGEQQHCCAAAVCARPRRAGRPSSACLSSPRATGLSPEPHLGCIRKLWMRTSQPRPQRRGVQAKDFPQISDERRFSRVTLGRK